MESVGDDLSHQADVRVVEEEDRYVLALTGEFDLVTAEILESTLDEVASAVPPRLIVLDMSEVEFIDSSGLKPLIRAHARGSSLAIRSASPTVQTVISITGLEEIFQPER